MEFQFPPFLRRRRRQTPQPQPSHITSTGRESVRLNISICSPAPAVASRFRWCSQAAGVQLERALSQVSGMKKSAPGSTQLPLQHDGNSSRQPRDNGHRCPKADPVVTDISRCRPNQLWAEEDKTSMRVCLMSLWWVSKLFAGCSLS